MDFILLFKQEANVDFSNVHFSYPTRPSVSVLKGFNMSVLNGRTVALVGQSGCGKSTVIQLLQRFYEPKDGEVRVDNDVIQNYNLTTLRSQMGIVSQEPNLFDRCVSNLLFLENVLQFYYLVLRVIYISTLKNQMR